MTDTEHTPAAAAPEGAASREEGRGAQAPEGACAPRPTILSLVGLTKEFGKGLRAVDHLDMEVCRGDVFGFLGPNGAGKTTTSAHGPGPDPPDRAATSRSSATACPATRSRRCATWAASSRRRPSTRTMSARRNLRLLGSMSGLHDEERIDEVLEIVGLRERADSKVDGFSHGMKQRLGIAQALLHKPELVDPRRAHQRPRPARHEGRARAGPRARPPGTTVFLRSHLLHEVEQVCTRAVIIDKGQVVIQGPVRSSSLGRWGSRC